MIRIFIYFLMWLNIVFASDFFHSNLHNPFKKKQKINFSLNDFSNYPIGLFDLMNELPKENFIIDNNFKFVTIKNNSLDKLNSFSYKVPFDSYIGQLLTKNQKFNIASTFITQSDSQKTEKKESYLQLASIDLGALGRASLKVTGNVNLSAKLVNQDQELVRSSFREQEKTNFKFDQKQQLNVQGKIGDRITISLDQNSERDFEWENTIRIDYQEEEDDILKRLEVGNISLSLPSTEFVTFSGQNKGLFGVKALSKLGPVNITSIASLEKTKKQSQKYKGTSELKINQIQDYEYRKNL